MHTFPKLGSSCVRMPRSATLLILSAISPRPAFFSALLTASGSFNKLFPSGASAAEERKLDRRQRRHTTDGSVDVLLGALENELLETNAAILLRRCTHRIFLSRQESAYVVAHEIENEPVQGFGTVQWIVCQVIATNG